MIGMLTHKHMMEKKANVLIHSFFMNYIFAIIWFCFYLIGKGQVFKYHSKVFDITKHEFTVINYCGIGLLKLLNIFFYLVPYIAIKMMMRKQ